MTALEKIKAIDESNRSGGPIPNGRIEFLLRAFREMREIALGDELVMGLLGEKPRWTIDEIFEERMKQ